MNLDYQIILLRDWLYRYSEFGKVFQYIEKKCFLLSRNPRCYYLLSQGTNGNFIHTNLWTKRLGNGDAFITFIRYKASFWLQAITGTFGTGMCNSSDKTFIAYRHHNHSTLTVRSFMAVIFMIFITLHSIYW